VTSRTHALDPHGRVLVRRSNVGWPRRAAGPTVVRARMIAMIAMIAVAGRRPANRTADA
jgi:hypothetical protein